MLHTIASEECTKESPLDNLPASQGLVQGSVAEIETTLLLVIHING